MTTENSKNDATTAVTSVPLSTNKISPNSSPIQPPSSRRSDAYGRIALSRKYLRDGEGRAKRKEKLHNPGTAPSSRLAESVIHLPCPLCVEIDRSSDSSTVRVGKKYKLYVVPGRGMAAHLLEAHRPWSPGSSVAKIMALSEERRRRQNGKKFDGNSRESVWNRVDYISSLHRKERPGERENWEAKVAQIVAVVERQCRCWHTRIEGREGENLLDFVLEHLRRGNGSDDGDAARVAFLEEKDRKKEKEVAERRIIPTQQYTSTKDKIPLPPICEAARVGDLNTIAKLTGIPVLYDGVGIDGDSHKSSKPNDLKDNIDIRFDLSCLSSFSKTELDSILSTITVNDRNGSIAEHWAAGGGHVTTCAYLIEVRRRVEHILFCRVADNSQEVGDESGGSRSSNISRKRKSMSINNEPRPKKLRRRDGRTSLHWSSRNGRISVLRYLLLQRPLPDVNVQTGDGTTPIHLAAYGGHVDAVRLLVHAGADISMKNAWECHVGHWAAMAVVQDDGHGVLSSSSIVDVCQFLALHGVKFHVPQKQGHTCAHKAAGAVNIQVLQWMAAKADEGGAGLSEEERSEAGAPDKGGNRPSDILEAVAAGDDEKGGVVCKIVQWMREEMGW